MERDFDSIKNEYGYIRHKNLMKYEEKKAKIYQENPELKKIDSDIISIYVKEGLSGNESDLNKLLALKKAEREEYLKKHSIEDDYLEVKYTCDKCKDTGFVDGKKCSCFIQKEIELFDSISNFRDIIKKDNFDNLNINLYSKEETTDDGKMSYRDYMKNAIRHMKDQISNIDNKPYNALFIGSTGTGKSYLAHSIGAEFIKKNKSVLYINVNEYLDSLKPDYKGEDLSEYAMLCDLLILDDLGSENQTEFTNSKLNYIISKRLDEDKSTIVTTNLDVIDLAKRYFNSMTSRLTSMYKKYYLKGDDIRGILYANV